LGINHEVAKEIPDYFEILSPFNNIQSCINPTCVSAFAASGSKDGEANGRERSEKERKDNK